MTFVCDTCKNSTTDHCADTGRWCDCQHRQTGSTR